ncbi:beta-xylosidase [Bacteroidia bacterium]|nr:beta-xylosidase [Bacteroidia bacterium]
MVLWINSIGFAQNIESTYRNPVIPGDFPDPTGIRVNENYYTAGTSSDYAPNYPIYHSVDLINWNRIGSIFNTPPEWIKGDCWAPELTHHNGRFFVYYTARRKSDGVSCIGVASTNDITQTFEDHGIIIEWGKEAIDAFVFQDDDGKRYILWKAYGLDNRPIEILCSELSDDGLSLRGQAFSLTDPKKGWTGRGDEGPCLIKHKEFYYLFYSVGGCCDRECDYHVFVARSKSLKGDWEQYDKNPILQGGGLWKCPGHGTIVVTPENRFFYLYHAYHSYDFEFIGRQGLLDELLWDEKGGWPFFRFGDIPSVQAETPFKNTVQKQNTRFFDNFRSNEKELFWSVDMKLTGCLADSCFQVRVIQPVSGNYKIETAIEIPEDTNLKGLLLYGDSSNYIVWGIENQHLKLYQCTKGKRSETFSKYLNAYEIYFRIESINARFFQFHWSEDRENWYSALHFDQVLNGKWLPQWGKGLRAGLFVENQSDDMGIFSYFLMENH